jgi:hypothetical protein
MNKLLALILFSAVCASHAQASMITVEPDDFANGTDISTATPGVLLDLKFGQPVYAYDTGDANYASTGTKVFGYDAGFGTEPYWDNQNTFRAIFSASAFYVALDVINNNGFGQGSDIATMQVFGTTGLLATIASSTLGFPGHQKLEYQSAFSNITYIQLTSSEGSDFNLDQLQFQVPEPSALLLMAMGLLGYLSTRGKQGNSV